MKDTLLIICNYNRCCDVDALLTSIFQQSAIFFDILVVDNNSTDNSFNFLSNKYKKCINLLKNKSNLGGSGGFNTGLKYALKKAYKYFVLLDSDVVLEQKCLLALKKTLTSSDEIGAVGAKVYMLNRPKTILSFGANIDWNNCTVFENGTGMNDGNVFSKVKKVDYISSCILMSKVEIIKKIGFFNEKFFLYFDDVDWCRRCSNAGWKIVVDPSAIGYHRYGPDSNKTSNTLFRYYFIRNSLIFFMSNSTYTRSEFLEKEISIRAETLCKNIFRGIFGSYTKNLTNVMLSYLEALMDAVSGITGKAPDYYNRINENFSYRKVEKLISDNIDKLIIIKTNNLDFKESYNIKRFFINMSSSYRKLNFKYCDGTSVGDERITQSDKLSLQRNPKNGTLIFNLCKSIYDLISDQSFKLESNNVYCDSYLNIIANSDDLLMFKSYDVCYTLFKACFYPKIVQRMELLIKSVNIK